MESGFRPEDVELLERRTAYRGFARLDVLALRHRRFAGGMGPVIKREVLIRPAGVGVIIYDPVRDLVLLVEQFRIGALTAGLDSPWQLEIVAGLVDAGESPEDVARREAVEEAGVVLGRTEFLFDFLMSPGSSNERFHLYVAEADLSAAGGVHGLPGEGEDIRVVVCTATRVLEALATGRITNAPALLALYWFRQNRDRLRSDWRK